MSRLGSVAANGVAVLGAAWVLAGCGGATFKFVETPWQGDEASIARLQAGAQRVGCSASEPDSTGEIEIKCPEGKPDPDRDAGSVRIGPAEGGNMLAMCNDGLAEGCPEALEQMWNAGGS